MKTQKTKLEIIEDAIKRNREKILKGGDRVYYSKQILNLNKLSSEIEK